MIAITQAEAEARFPRCWAIARAAAAALATEARPMCCRHAVRPGRPDMLCAQHPGAGLMCARCIDRHARRHDQGTELTCDECGDLGVQGLLCAAIVMPAPAGLEVRDTSGRHRFVGAFTVIGVGACRRCAATPTSTRPSTP